MSQILLPYNFDLNYDKDFYKDYGIFVKPIDYPMSTKKIESLLEIAKVISHNYNAGISFVPYPQEQLLIETGSTFFSFNKLQKIISYSFEHLIDDWVIEQ